MNLRELIEAESGKCVYDDGYTCPVLGPVRLRSLTEEEFQDGVLLWSVNQDWTRNRDKRRHENAKLLQMCLVDAQGNTLFTDSPADIAKLAGLRTAIFQPLYERAYEFNRPTPKK